MTKFIIWLEDNRWKNIILLLIYYLLVVLPHEEVGKLAANIFGGLTRESYNLVILIFGLVISAIVLALLFRKLIYHPNKKQIIFFLLASILFVIICVNVLFVMNIEGIHFIQYGIFTIICFPLFNNHIQTLLFATVAGALDEAFQYFYLAPQRTDYYDWNDVIINLVGGALGLLVILILSIQLVRKSKSFFRSFSIYVLAGLLLVVAVLFFSGTLTVYLNDALPKAVALVKEIPDGFWSFPPGPYVKYHVVMPFEGLIIITLLLLFYSRLDYIN